MLFNLKLKYSYRFIEWEVQKLILFRCNVNYTSCGLLPSFKLSWVYFNFEQLLDVVGNWRFDWHWLLLWLVLRKPGRIFNWKRILRKGSSMYRFQLGVFLDPDDVVDFMQVVQEYIVGLNGFSYYGELNRSTVLFRITDLSIFNNMRLLPGVFFFRVLDYLNCNFVLKNLVYVDSRFFYSLYKLS